MAIEKKMVRKEKEERRKVIVIKGVYLKEKEKEK